MSSAFPNVGSTIDGRYRLISLLGTAPGGQVVAARDELYNGEVTLRLVAPEHARGFRGFKETAIRLCQERIAGVVAVQVSKDGHLPYLVMSPLRGEELGRLVRAGPMPWMRAVAIAEACARVLAEVHGHGCVHGALRSGCIYVERASEEVPLIQMFDFRAAELLSQVVPGESSRQTIAFNKGVDPDYSPPEQILGERPQPKSDVYSLGVLLFEMLAGRLPFVGEKRAIAHGHNNVRPPRVADVVPGCKVPDNVEWIVAQALSKSGAERFTMHAFATALQGARSSDTSFDDQETRPMSRRDLSAVPQFDPFPSEGRIGPGTLSIPRQDVLGPSEVPGVAAPPPVTVEVSRPSRGPRAVVAPGPLSQETAEVPRRGAPETAEVPRRGAPETAEVPRRWVQETAEVPRRGVQETAEVPRRGVQETAMVPRRGPANIGGAPSRGPSAEPQTMVVVDGVLVGPEGARQRFLEVQRGRTPETGLRVVPQWERRLQVALFSMLGLCMLTVLVLVVVILA